MYSSIQASSNRRSIKRRRPNRTHIVEDVVNPVDLSRKERLVANCRVLYNCIRRIVFGVSDGYDTDYDEFDVQVVHYKPSNLDELCQATKFSREEIKLIYRGFKQECPAGVVDEERFKELYSQFYPLGDGRQFAGYIFATFDQDEDGHVTFDQFITGMSVLSRGTMAQKLRWVFNLYDLNGSGRVSWSNLKDIVASIHTMLGCHGRPPTDDLTMKQHVDRMFEKFDLDRNGEISFAEFLSACENDPAICRSMVMFDTVL